MHPHPNNVSYPLLSGPGEKSCIDRILPVLFQCDGADLLEIGPTLQDFVYAVLE